MARRLFLHGLAAIACSVAAVPSAAFFWSAPSWPDLKARIRKENPLVPQVTTAQLKARLDAGQAVRLIDVRAHAEYAVSHLRGAERLSSADAIAKTLATKDTPVLLYCSVGYRSAQLATKLHAMGYTKVANLEGSLFEWANLGYPVYLQNQVVKTVHPFDRVWGELLDARYRDGG
jgi:rhodanese-related sulfurtransferase